MGFVSRMSALQSKRAKRRRITLLARLAMDAYRKNFDFGFPTTHGSQTLVKAPRNLKSSSESADGFLNS